MAQSKSAINRLNTQLQVENCTILDSPLQLKAQMYEFVRKLTPRQFAEIYDINIKTGVHFDHLIVQAMQKGE